MPSTNSRVFLSLTATHAGLNHEFGKFEGHMRAVIARIDEPRMIVKWLDFMQRASHAFCLAEGVDMRGWLQRVAGEVGGRASTDKRARSATGRY